VLGASLVTPALVWVDKAIQLHRQSEARERARVQPGERIDDAIPVQAGA
jgi:hypothetical protein